MKKLASVLISVFILTFSVVLVFAIDDGRINRVAHAGANVIYCIAPNGELTSNYDAMISSGGRLDALTPNGNVVMRVDGPQLGEIYSQALANQLSASMLIESVPGQHGFGNLDLYVTPGATFLLIGFDEHGKTFDFSWTRCNPVGPVGSPSAVELPSQVPFTGDPTDLTQVEAYCDDNQPGIIEVSSNRFNLATFTFESVTETNNCASYGL